MTTTPAARAAQPLSILMCRPTYFDVEYTINPWMDPTVPVDRDLAIRQWETLRATYLDLGIDVVEVDPAPGLPDMVYAANGALVIDGIAKAVRFRYAERAGEEDLYAARLAELGFRVVPAVEINEGEGDLLLAGEAILAGTGFRSARESHAELARDFGREVVTLELARPEFYHLDTALSVLDDRPGHEDIAYLPSAFTDDARAELERRFPGALLADEGDARVLGLNLVSDGLHVVMPVQAAGLAAGIAARGYEVVPVDMSELLKGGGGAKCCTLTLRR